MSDLIDKYGKYYFIFLCAGLGNIRLIGNLISNNPYIVIIIMIVCFEAVNFYHVSSKLLKYTLLGIMFQCFFPFSILYLIKYGALPLIAATFFVFLLVIFEDYICSKTTFCKLHIIKVITVCLILLSLILTNSLPLRTGKESTNDMASPIDNAVVQTIVI